MADKMYMASQLPRSSSFPNIRLFLSSKDAVSPSSRNLSAFTASDWRIQLMRLLGTKNVWILKKIFAPSLQLRQIFLASSSHRAAGLQNLGFVLLTYLRLGWRFQSWDDYFCINLSSLEKWSVWKFVFIENILTFKIFNVFFTDQIQQFFFNLSLP